MKPQVRTLEQAPVDIAASRLPPPILSYVGGRQWRLEADYSYRDAETTITIAKGFQFVTVSSDARLIAAGAQQVMAKMRAGQPKPAASGSY